jgi:putative chitinase
MPSFTSELIKGVCPFASIDILNDIIPHMNSFGALYKITINKLRMAHFIGQIAQESGGFTKLEENLNYTHAERVSKVFPKLAGREESLLKNPVALANAAYANKLGNRDEASGDGWKYHGRGLIQLTGHDNYRDFGKIVGIDLTQKPELAAMPDYAVRLAMMFWDSRGCNALADLNDYKRITKAINGPALEGLQARTSFTDKALALIK